MTRTAMRVGGAIALAHVIVAMAGFAVQFRQIVDLTLTAPRENLTTFFVEGDPGPTFLGGHLEMFGYLLLLPFAAALHRLLRSSEPGGGIGANTAVLAATIFVATTLSPGLAAGGAALWMGSHGGDLTSIEVLNQLRNTTYVTSLAAYALFFVAIGCSALAGRSLPKWLSVSALGLGVWLVVGVAFFTSGQADLPALAGLFWVLAAGIWLLRAKTRPIGPALTVRAEAVSVA